jgi:hypothetical protein
MTTSCHLEAEGFRLTFHLSNGKGEDWMDGLLALSLHPDLGGLTVHSAPTAIQENDLRGLIAYFEDHIARLQQDPDAESATFTPLELGFQLQALAGDVESADEGAFTLRALLNVGQREGCSRTYVGAEGVVEVANVRAFTHSLEQLLSGLASAH